MSGESISFIMIVIEVQKCFVFESYYTNITRIVDSYPPVGVDSSHLSVCFSFRFFFWILLDSTPSIVNDDTLIFFGRVLPVPGPAMTRLCYQMISLPTMPLLERDLTCQALLGIVYHQMRYRCLWGRSFDFLEQVLAESWSDHLSHPRSHVVIRPPDFTCKDTVAMTILTLIIIHLTAITLTMVIITIILINKGHKNMTTHLEVLTLLLSSPFP